MRYYPIGDCLSCPLSASIPGIGWYCMEEEKEVPDVSVISSFCTLKEVEE